MSEAAAPEMKPELSDLQGKARSYVNWATVAGIRRLGRFVDAIPSGLLVGVCGMCVFGLYAHMYFVLPWVLWRHMLIDTLTFLLLPFLLATYWKTIGDISEFLRYEDLKDNYGLHDDARDVDLHPWEARKYYEHVTQTSLRFISESCDVYDSEEDRESVTGEEEDVKPKAEEKERQAKEDVRPEAKEEENVRPEAKEEENVRPEAKEEENVKSETKEEEDVIPEAS